MKKIRYKIDSLDKDFKKRLHENLEVLKANLEANVKKQEEMLEETVISIEHARVNNFVPTEQLWNLAGFVMILSMDLKTTMHSILTSNHEWMKRLHLRQACLITHEAISDLFQLLGKRFRNLLDEHFNNPSLNQDFDAIRIRLNEFKRLHQDRIKKVRNIAIAHKDHDIGKQIQQITDLSLNENLIMLLNFDDILNDLGGAIKQTINSDLLRLGVMHRTDHNI